MAKGHRKNAVCGSQNSGSVGRGLSRVTPLTDYQRIARAAGLPDDEVQWLSDRMVTEIVSLRSAEAMRILFTRYALKLHRPVVALAASL